MTKTYSRLESTICVIAPPVNAWSKTMSFTIWFKLAALTCFSHAAHRSFVGGLQFQYCKQCFARQLPGSTIMSSERVRREERNEEEETDSSGGSVPRTLTPIQERQTSPILLSGQMWIYDLNWIGVQAVRLQLKGAIHNFHLSDLR